MLCLISVLDYVVLDAWMPIISRFSKNRGGLLQHGRQCCTGATQPWMSAEFFTWGKWTNALSSYTAAIQHKGQPMQ
jgi:hypothetical protein